MFFCQLSQVKWLAYLQSPDYLVLLTFLLYQKNKIPLLILDVAPSRVFFPVTASSLISSSSGNKICLLTFAECSNRNKIRSLSPNSMTHSEKWVQNCFSIIEWAVVLILPHVGPTLWDSGQMTIAKTHPTLLIDDLDQFHLRWLTIELSRWETRLQIL